MNRISTINQQIDNISPLYFRPTKEMLEKYEKIWLPLRKASKSKKVFLIYGDFDIIEIDDKPRDTSNKVNNKVNSKSLKLSSNRNKKKSENSKTKKKVEIIKGKKRTWTLKNT